GGDDQVEPAHLAVGVQGGLAPLRGWRPLDEGLGYLRLHVLAPSYGATARTRFCTKQCCVQTCRFCPCRAIKSRFSLGVSASRPSNLKSWHTVRRPTCNQ